MSSLIQKVLGITALTAGGTLAGAGIGAAVGAAVGTIFFPGIGTAAGALTGGEIGALCGAATGTLSVGGVTVVATSLFLKFKFGQKSWTLFALKLEFLLLS